MKVSGASNCNIYEIQISPLSKARADCCWQLNGKNGTERGSNSGGRTGAFRTVIISFQPVMRWSNHKNSGLIEVDVGHFSGSVGPDNAVRGQLKSRPSTILYHNGPRGLSQQFQR